MGIWDILNEILPSKVLVIVVVVDFLPMRCLLAYPLRSLFVSC